MSTVEWHTLILQRSWICMAIIRKSDHSLLASLGIAILVITGLFAMLAINFRRNETTELRSRAFNDPYSGVPTPKTTLSPDACVYVYREHCYGDQGEVDRAKSNYERSQKVMCYLPSLCPPPVEQPKPLGECPYNYDGRCYSSQSDADDAEYMDTKGPNDPAVEAPVPIDQN